MNCSICAEMSEKLKLRVRCSYNARTSNAKAAPLHFDLYLKDENETIPFNMCLIVSKSESPRPASCSHSALVFADKLCMRSILSVTTPSVLVHDVVVVKLNASSFVL